MFWDQSFRMAPQQCRRFARALWNQQIDHQGSLSYSRHAMIFKGDHPSRRGAEFPRHGGFYIATWAHAYQSTNDPVMLQAITELTAFFETNRDPATGAIPAYLQRRDMMWPPSNVSLAIDLHDAAGLVPAALGARLRRLAASIDETYLRLPHDPGPGGKGFVINARTADLTPYDAWNTPEEKAAGQEPSWYGYTGGWRSAYHGQHPHAPQALICALRYAQTGEPRYRRLILACADNYLASAPDLAPYKRPDNGATVYPDVEAGSIGDVMAVLNTAYRLSGQEKYLQRAEWFGRWALAHYWPDRHPLPCASVRENVYSAPSRSDTLAMALLHTWILRHAPDSKVSLIDCDR